MSCWMIALLSAFGGGAVGFLACAFLSRSPT